MRLIEQVVSLSARWRSARMSTSTTRFGLDGLHALLRVRETVRNLIDIQIVAFPQSGIVACPGVADLLDNAIREGADLVGGLDPAGIDGDVDGPSRCGLRASPSATASASTSTCTIPARSAASSCARSRRARKPLAFRAASRSATPSRWARSTMPNFGGLPRRSRTPAWRS